MLDGITTVPLFVIASSFVKSIGTVGEDTPEPMASTFHSASCSHNAMVEESFFDTVFPVERFVMVAMPVVVDVAVTFNVTESPALNAIPEKS